MIANHNRQSTGGNKSNKELRRELIISRAKDAGLTPEEVFSFSGYCAYDFKLFLPYAPSARYLSLERSDSAYRIRSEIFEHPNVEMFISSFGNFLNGKPIYVVNSDNCKVKADNADEIRGRKFDLIYLDYVDTTKKRYLEQMDAFLTHHVRERFVLAVAHTINPHFDKFSEYADIANKHGASFERLDYQDTAPMAFAIMVR